MTDDQHQEAVGVLVQLFLRQVPLDRVHALASQVTMDLNIKTYKMASDQTYFNETKGACVQTN